MSWNYRRDGHASSFYLDCAAVSHSVNKERLRVSEVWPFWAQHLCTVFYFSNHPLSKTFFFFGKYYKALLTFYYRLETRRHSLHMVPCSLAFFHCFHPDFIYVIVTACSISMTLTSNIEQNKLLYLVGDYIIWFQSICYKLSSSSFWVTWSLDLEFLCFLVFDPPH